MAIYERPTKTLMAEWAQQNLKPGQVFSKTGPTGWFARHYPKIKRNTVHMHVEGMSVNNRNRKHHSNVKPGSGHDLFFKLGPDQYRLWNKESDPPPFYKYDLESQPDSPGAHEEASDVGSDAEEQADSAATAFAFERDLRGYLVKNLSVVEPGLRVYEEEGITGEEFPVGGRFIDILAVDTNGGYVVIELKVSRGYDRVLGQLLRYMAWVEQNMDAPKPVRGVIVAKEITDDLKLAASRVRDIKLIEYKLSFELRQI